jgi:hypothetical protein
MGDVWKKPIGIGRDPEVAFLGAAVPAAKRQKEFSPTPTI